MILHSLLTWTSSSYFLISLNLRQSFTYLFMILLTSIILRYLIFHIKLSTSNLSIVLSKIREDYSLISWVELMSLNLRKLWWNNLIAPNMLWWTLSIYFIFLFFLILIRLSTRACATHYNNLTYYYIFDWKKV